MHFDKNIEKKCKINMHKLQVFFCICLLFCIIFLKNGIECKASCKKTIKNADFTGKTQILTGLDNIDAVTSTLSKEKEQKKEENFEKNARELSDQIINSWNSNNMEKLFAKIDSVSQTIPASIIWEKILSGQIPSLVKMIWKSKWEGIWNEWTKCRYVIVMIILISVFSALFTIITDIVKEKQVALISQYFLYLLLSTFLIKIFNSLYDIAQATCLDMTEFVKLLLPAFILSLGMTNGQATAGIYYESILFVNWCVEHVILHYVLPAITSYMLFIIIGGIWQENRFDILIKNLRKLLEWVLKLFLWGAGSVGILQSMITPVMDSLQWNMVKQVGSLVPGIGNLSEGVSEIFVGSALLIRNGVGVFITILLFSACFMPILKLMLLALVLKLSAALSGVVNQGKIAQTTDQVADAAFLLCRTVITGMGIFLMSIAIMILATHR